MRYIIPFGKYRGKNYFDLVNDHEALRYFHWACSQDGIKTKYPDFYSILQNTLPRLHGPAVFTRNIKEDEKAKIKVFNRENTQNILRLYVARTWGHRTLATNSAAWRTLREQVIQRDSGECRFCKTRFNKFLIVDHIDGDASNNNLSNLGLNCKGCDMIRHCGKAGLDKNLIIRLSTLDQVEIVKRSYQFYLEVGKNPTPEDIDSTNRKITLFEIKDKNGQVLEIIENTTNTELYSTSIGNILLKYNYEELNEEFNTSIKGFFSQSFDFTFLGSMELEQKLK